jgi:3-hydroxybutyrate dehydrogenase
MIGRPEQSSDRSGEQTAVTQPHREPEMVGRVALVAGGAGALGRAIAESLAAAGVEVIIGDLDLQRAEAVASKLSAASLMLDVTSAESCQSAVEEVVRRFGRLDIAVGTAGVQYVAPVHELPPEEWDHVLRVNLTGAFLLMRAALPVMYSARWGRVVNIASAFALVGAENKPAYTASKHGLIGLTKAAALEAAHFGVTVNAVCPAWVRTPLVLGQVADLARARGIPESEVESQVMLGPSPIHRFIEPAEVASAVRFLCLPTSGAITGSSLVIDGGWSVV